MGAVFIDEAAHSEKAIKHVHLPAAVHYGGLPDPSPCPE